MNKGPIDANLIAEQNRRQEKAHLRLRHLGEQLARRKIDIDKVTRVAAFAVALPSWGVGTGGTRFARYPGPASRAMSSTS